jgi:hypothetical protein
LPDEVYELRLTQMETNVSGLRSEIYGRLGAPGMRDMLLGMQKDLKLVKQQKENWIQIVSGLIVGGTLIIVGSLGFFMFYLVRQIEGI